MTRYEAINELSSNKELSFERIIELRKILVDTNDDYVKANAWVSSGCTEERYDAWADSGCTEERYYDAWANSGCTETRHDDWRSSDC